MTSTQEHFVFQCPCCSRWTEFVWPDCVEIIGEHVAYFRGFGDELANKEFHNSKLGVPFIGDGAKVTDDDLQACIRNHTKDDARPEMGGEG